MNNLLRLGVNIDHVATIRNARGGELPDPARAAIIAEKAGADGITAHLREDRRHISDNDIELLMNSISIPLNLEMAATEEMMLIALKHKPKAVCLVPEKREERTTEGGLDIYNNIDLLRPFIKKLSKNGIRVSLFIEPDQDAIQLAKDIEAPVIELHTGAYCNTRENEQKKQLTRIIVAAEYANKIGLECHAGHGLTFDTVYDIASISTISELNIGHFLIGEAIFSGLSTSIKKMRNKMNEARAALEKKDSI